MKFKLVKEGCEDVPVYGGGVISTGGTVDLDGFLAEKARANPDFEEVKARRKPNGDKDGNQE